MNLRVRLEKLEQLAAAADKDQRTLTNDELLAWMFGELHAAAVDRQAIETGRPCAPTDGGFLRAGAIDTLAERGNTLAGIVLSIRPWIEEMRESIETSAIAYADAILAGLRPINEQHPRSTQ